MEQTISTYPIMPLDWGFDLVANTTQLSQRFMILAATQDELWDNWDLCRCTKNCHVAVSLVFQKHNLTDESNIWFVLYMFKNHDLYKVFQFKV